MRLTPPWRTALCVVATVVLIAYAFFLNVASAVAATSVASPVSMWARQLNQIELKIEAPDVSNKALFDLRDQLDEIEAKANALVSERSPQLAVQRDDLATLGPPPAAGQPPELPTITARRQALSRQISAIEGELTEVQLIQTQTERLRGTIAALRRERFANQILVKGPSPLSAEVWSRAMRILVTSHGSVSSAIANLFRPVEFGDQLRQASVTIGLALLLATALLWPLRRWFLRRYGRDSTIVAPTHLQLLRAMMVTTIARALLPTIAGALIYGFLLNEDLLSDAGRSVAKALFLAFLLFTWSVTFVRASMMPADLAWRVIAVPTAFARSLRNVVASLILVLSIDIVLSALIATYNARLEISIIREFVLSCVICALLLSFFVRRNIWKFSSDVNAASKWRLARFAVALILVAAPLAGAIGYVSLGRFVALQIFFSGGLLAFLLFVRQMGNALIVEATAGDALLDERLRQAFASDRKGVDRVQFWASLALDATLIPFGILIELFLWGADWHDISGFAYRAFLGIQVGGLKISLNDIVVAILIFASAVAVTRVLQHVFAKRILPQTRLDHGVRDSIRIGIGYLGITIAVTLGISALGLDLSNLAIVAGAFSVGIGFGLQNVVNNFVSGLILLVERPLKVGDWISVSGIEGYVKKINVRSTEVELFDKASVFIPNSELTSKALMNRSHPDTTARVAVPVGVAYGSDVEKVKEILSSVAKAHPAIVSYPAPSVAFMGFGDSALNFELRAFIANVGDIVTVSSDMCFAIDKAFRHGGIEIPFPQRDIHIKSP